MSGFTRRHLMGRGLAGAGALAVPGALAVAEAAHAQGDAQTEALERLIELEQAAELGYSLAAEEGDLETGTKALFEELSIHCRDRDGALSEAVDQLLVDPPEKSSDQEDYESLDDLDPTADEKDLLEFLIGLEEELITAYEEEEPQLDAPDLIRTAAQIAASHAQALVALRLIAAGAEQFDPGLPARSASATATEEEDSDS
jgi:rubrerythrin